MHPIMLVFAFSLSKEKGIEYFPFITRITRKDLTAKTRNGMTSTIISVDLTPIALKKPTDPRTESMTSTTPERPNNT